MKKCLFSKKINIYLLSYLCFILLHYGICAYFSHSINIFHDRNIMILFALFVGISLIGFASLFLNRYFDNSWFGYINGILTILVSIKYSPFFLIIKNTGIFVNSGSIIRVCSIVVFIIWIIMIWIASFVGDSKGYSSFEGAAVFGSTFIVFPLAGTIVYFALGKAYLLASLYVIAFIYLASVSFYGDFDDNTHKSSGSAKEIGGSIYGISTPSSSITADFDDCGYDGTDIDVSDM